MSVILENSVEKLIFISKMHDNDNLMPNIRDNFF
jgi:hypothetical protein